MQWCTDNNRETHLWGFVIDYYNLNWEKFSNRLHIFHILGLDAIM